MVAGPGRCVKSRRRTRRRPASACVGLQTGLDGGIFATAPMTTRMTPRALVVLRVARGAPPPDDATIRAAIGADRARLALPAGDGEEYRLAGPYAIELAGRALDEYVAWEV